MITSCRRIAFLLLLMVFIGCQKSRRDTEVHLSGSGLSPMESPCEQFIFVAEGLSKELRDNLKSHIGKLIANASAGTIIHVIRTPDHRVVARLKIPNSSGRVRLRNRDLTDGLANVNALLSDEGFVPEVFREQLSLDKLVSTFWSNRETDFPCRISLVGSPIYHDPKLEQWTFRVCRYPSDSTINHPESGLPFISVGRTSIPTDVAISWLTSSPWKKNKEHEDAVTRFYRQAFKNLLGGNFVRFTSDAQAAFDNNSESGFSELDELNDPLPPRMLEIPYEEGSSEIPEKIVELMKEVSADPNRSLVAINWESPYASTDLDLWVRKGSDKNELYFRNTETPFGYLIRDVRHSGDNSSTDIVGKWEVAVLNAPLSAFQCWLDAFDSDGSPIRVKLVTISRGEQATREFDLQVDCGDHAKGVASRSNHKAWTKLDLGGI